MRDYLKIWFSVQLAMVVLLIALFSTSVKAESASFVVTASNTWGESGYSEEVSCEMVNEGAYAVLTWNASLGATSYTVYYKPPWQTDYNKVKSVTVTGLTATVYAVAIFKIEGVPVLIIQCEDGQGVSP